MCACNSNNNNVSCINCIITPPSFTNGTPGVGISTIIQSGQDIVITLTNGVIITLDDAIPSNGDDGLDGQSIDHVALTSGTSAPGTTDVYTVWGDSGETINLGNFAIYNGSNGTNGTNGTNNMAILYSFVTSQEAGFTVATTGSWATMKSYTLPANTVVTEGHYLDMDIKLQTTSGSLLGIPLDYFKLTFDGANIINKYPLGTELIPLTNFNTGEPATYNLNIKLFKTASTPMQASCTFHRNEVWGTPSSARLAGAIQVSSSELGTKNLTLGGVINFQVYQTGANSVKLESIIIKHVKS